MSDLRTLMPRYQQIENWREASEFVRDVNAMLLALAGGGTVSSSANTASGGGGGGGGGGGTTTGLTREQVMAIESFGGF